MPAKSNDWKYFDAFLRSRIESVDTVEEIGKIYEDYIAAFPREARKTLSEEDTHFVLELRNLLLRIKQLESDSSFSEQQEYSKKKLLEKEDLSVSLQAIWLFLKFVYVCFKGIKCPDFSFSVLLPEDLRALAYDKLNRLKRKNKAVLVAYLYYYLEMLLFVLQAFHLFIWQKFKSNVIRRRNDF